MPPDTNNITHMQNTHAHRPKNQSATACQTPPHFHRPNATAPAAAETLFSLTFLASAENRQPCRNNTVCEQRSSERKKTLVLVTFISLWSSLRVLWKGCSHTSTHCSGEENSFFSQNVDLRDPVRLVHAHRSPQTWSMRPSCVSMLSCKIKPKLWSTNSFRHFSGNCCFETCHLYRAAAH